jgi:hypothetical protein
MIASTGKEISGAKLFSKIATGSAKVTIEFFYTLPPNY